MELVDLGESAFSASALLIDVTVEKPLAASFGSSAGTRVLDNVGNELMVEAGPARCFGVKRRICVEVTAGNGNPLPLDELEGGSQMVFELKRVVMIAGNNPGRGQNEPVSGGILPWAISVLGL
ncbi:MAG: hypothetical protein IPK52_16550 [Chloroflexi bacterium]|nr:hypothetical protein [Chloroflexota bacterium]